MSRSQTKYRMGAPNRKNNYIRPVNKVVTKTDGKIEYVQLEKAVASSLAEFRERFPTEPVEGAPVGDELRVVTSELTDEQLSEIGLTRLTPVEAVAVEVDPVQFASDEAENRAVEASLDLIPGGGSGQNGAYTASDIRFMIATAE